MKHLPSLNGSILTLFILEFFLSAGNLNGQSNTKTITIPDGIKKFPVQNVSWDLLASWISKDKIPFSFKCDDHPSAELLKKVSDNPRVYTAMNGTLLVTYELKEYPQNGCIEWVVKIKNTGSTDSPIISDLLALDLDIPLFSKEIQPKVYHSFGNTGGDGSRIDLFLYSFTSLLKGKSVQLSNPGGGKTFNWLPFFNLEIGNRGIIGALGWAGRWMINIDRSRQDTVCLRAGMECLHTVLRPGEEIRTPSILLMAWEGDRNEGHNRLRRHILENHIPRYDGQLVTDLMSVPTWGSLKAENHLKLIETIKRERLPYNCYWIDADWYGPPYEGDEYWSPKSKWYTNVGDWRVNTMVYPNGIKPISDAAHKAGMKFLFYYEPERAFKTTPLVTGHPEWFFRREPDKFRMFNFGIPEARKWMTDFISGQIREFGIDVYRQDGNFGLANSWADEDTPDRVGMSEVRYVEGLNEFWDELRRRFPDLILDIIQRLDLETISRGVDLSRADYSLDPLADPTGGQVSLDGIAHWIPITGTTNMGVRPGDTYHLLSDFSPSLGLPIFPVSSDKPVITSAPDDYPWDWHRKVMELHKKASPFFRGDYYPLLKSSTSPDDWSAMQFHRTDLNAGMVMFFRRPQSPFTNAVFPLHGLSADSNYLIGIDGDLPKTVKGSELMDKGLQVTAELPRTANIIFYNKVMK